MADAGAHFGGEKTANFGATFVHGAAPIPAQEDTIPIGLLSQREQPRAGARRGDEAFALEPPARLLHRLVRCHDAKSD